MRPERPHDAKGRRVSAAPATSRRALRDARRVVRLDYQPQLLPEPEAPNRSVITATFLSQA